ncbi:ImmA/IrrE family metallo-endopeptidase [Xenorhabdus sp. Vera]|uniref:XRE family transcriptional regulator n=1 Tax=Xenorhabdus koppenhoeferi TaxID=351659 RepID=UPI0019B07BFD|nr:XRE family transcriptional regulator [Xenorhabdus sp. Vera]MBD2811850.1 ImmA/IrrE family metallo-endopeptidase [Xenorhabdus sp. Vera]
MSKPNPEMLRWAREQAGLSMQEAAKKLSLKSSRMSGEDVLGLYESGEKIPTRNQLNEFAKTYHRSFITFFLETPPVIADKGEDFRTLPNGLSPLENGSVNSLIREVYVKQHIVKEAIIDSDSVVDLPFVGSLAKHPSLHEAKAKLLEFSKIDVIQYRKQKNSHESFNYLRQKVEDMGIFVLLIGNLGSHHSNISVEYFRGFALSDDIAPFVVINDNDSKYAWCFTLLHELAHIFIGKTGVSNSHAENNVEKYCNDIASQILLCESDFDVIDSLSGLPIEEMVNRISELSADLNVSSSMISYRLFSQNRINKEDWIYVSSYFKEKWLTNKEELKSSGGGSYYPTKRHKVGNALIEVVRRSIMEGVLTETKAGKVLGVRSGNVTELVGL